MAYKIILRACVALLCVCAISIYAPGTCAAADSARTAQNNDDVSIWNAYYFDIYRGGGPSTPGAQPARARTAGIPSLITISDCNTAMRVLFFPVPGTAAHAPVMATRMGGHAPPAAACSQVLH